jgi:hypothetical protein
METLHLKFLKKSGTVSRNFTRQKNNQHDHSQNIDILHIKNDITIVDFPKYLLCDPDDDMIIKLSKPTKNTYIVVKNISHFCVNIVSNDSSVKIDDQDYICIDEIFNSYSLPIIKNDLKECRIYVTANPISATTSGD